MFKCRLSNLTVFKCDVKTCKYFKICKSTVEQKNLSDFTGCKENEQ